MGQSGNDSNLRWTRRPLSSAGFYLLAAPQPATQLVLHAGPQGPRVVTQPFRRFERMPAEPRSSFCWIPDL